MTARPSLRGLLLANAVAYTALILVTGALAIVGMRYWDEASRESLRLYSMLAEIQDLRGNLYRQVKEVFDEVFLEDVEAPNQYLAYAQRIDRQFETLANVAVTGPETEAVQALRQAYEGVRNQSRHILQSPEQFTPRMRLHAFDIELEQGAFGSFESAFQSIDSVLFTQQNDLRERLAATTRYAPIALSLPVLLGIVLLVTSRAFLKHGLVAPVSAMLEATRRLSGGELDHKVPETGAAELAALAHAINRMAAELASSRELLLRAEKQATLGALVPVLAHNIRNPLSSIRATAQVLDDPALPEEVRQGLADIIGTADRLERWTYSLLFYLNPLQPRLSPSSLAEVADGALALLGPELARRGLRVVRENWSAATTLQLDTRLMEQCLHGLLTNAIEASPDGGIITLTLQTGDARAALVIADQGQGINFCPRPEGLSPGPSTKQLGSGLGIPFAMKVCDLHGGRLEFDGLPGAGTRVILSLPVEQPAPAELTTT